MLKRIFNESMNNSKETILNYPWENPQAYANWLAQSYYFVKHSTRLLCLVGYKANFEQEAFHKRVGEHIHEEKGHELIAKGDLKRLGFDINSFDELPETKLFYRNQYYACEHLSPYYLMGYILYLEGVACLIYPETYKRIKEAYGEKCGLFLKLHVEEDVDHLESAFSQVEKISALEQKYVMESLKISEAIYLDILKQISPEPTEYVKKQPVRLQQEVVGH